MAASEPAAAIANGCCDDEATAQAKLEQMMAQQVEGTESAQKQGELANQGDSPCQHENDWSFDASSESQLHV